MAFLFLDDRHAHPKDVSAAEAELVQRVLMSDSARYAEIAVFYSNKMRDGEKLTAAEEARLELVQRQQQRINETLIGGKK